MIKLYCDRCGKETNRLSDVKIPGTKGSLSFATKTVALCVSCEKEADNLHDKATDVHFLLFRDFMKKEGDE